MLKRDIVLPPEHLFPPHDWSIVETRFSTRFHERAETVLALSNGYVGVRGTHEEGRPVLAPGTFVNGFHETWPIPQPEPAYGLANTGQTLVTVPDATRLRLYVDDEPLYLPTARMPEYRRELDLRTGTLSRDLVWSTGSGKHLRVVSRRLVSLEERHLLAFRYEVTALDHACAVVVASQLVDHRQDNERNERSGDPRAARALGYHPLDRRQQSAVGLRLLAGYQTRQSGMTLGVGVDHVVECATPFKTSATWEGGGAEVLVTVELPPGERLVITKYATYQSSRQARVAELAARCDRTLDREVDGSFDRLCLRQREHLDRFWDRADVRVRSDRVDRRLQQAIRWNLFQVAQATWCAQGAGVPAKGLTGQAYDGHYFWDTEVYLVPFLAFTQPRLARNLLRFRYSMLDKARKRARVMGQRGAMFPWRTINGEEASANFQAGTAQYHINADISYAMRHYTQVRGDPRFAAQLSAEVLVETARLWEDLGFYGTDGRFHIHGVTGPDEYTTVVNDNTFTNLMARENLRSAASTVRWMAAERPDDYVSLVDAVSLAPGEAEAWQAAADAMYIPYDERLGIHPQDHAFLDREVWDLEATPRDQFPLLLHHHPLVIYRFQVLKQADIVLAMLLLGDQFSPEQKRRNFDYYDRLTTGDSSLSASVQSILAAEVGLEREALEYFGHALLMDLGDVAGNTSDGVHVASAAGVWLALVRGFGGMRDRDERLSFDPRLPAAWQELEFSLRFHDRQLRVRLTHEGDRYLVEAGPPLEVVIRGCPRVLEPGVPFEDSVAAAAR